MIITRQVSASPMLLDFFNRVLNVQIRSDKIFSVLYHNFDKINSMSFDEFVELATILRIYIYSNNPTRQEIIELINEDFRNRFVTLAKFINKFKSDQRVKSMFFFNLSINLYDGNASDYLSTIMERHFEDSNHSLETLLYNCSSRYLKYIARTYYNFHLEDNDTAKIEFITQLKLACKTLPADQHVRDYLRQA